MDVQQIKRLKTISEYHRSRQLPSPIHPLISVIDYRDILHSDKINSVSWVYDFYLIALKKNIEGKFRYGQQTYDFDEGTMFFIAPNQVMKIEVKQDLPDRSGWMLLIHPDFLWGTTLAKKIKQREFFGYTTREALFLSGQEEANMKSLVNTINKECWSNMDNFTQQIIVSQIELLLNYGERFYYRQFLTRKVSSHGLVQQMEKLLTNFFAAAKPNIGLPTVNFLADQMNLSPDYLSSLLKIHTGLNAQQHIHEKIIERAKERLLTSDLTVSEIAYELGFEHSQSFSKLFKSKTSQTPKEFRISFN